MEQKLQQEHDEMERKMQQEREEMERKLQQEREDMEHHHRTLRANTRHPSPMDPLHLAANTLTIHTSSTVVSKCNAYKEDMAPRAPSPHTRSVMVPPQWGNDAPIPPPPLHRQHQHHASCTWTCSSNLLPRLHNNSAGKPPQLHGNAPELEAPQRKLPGPTTKAALKPQSRRGEEKGNTTHLSNISHYSVKLASSTSMATHPRYTPITAAFSSTHRRPAAALVRSNGSTHEQSKQALARPRPVGAEPTLPGGGAPRRLALPAAWSARELELAWLALRWSSLPAGDEGCNRAPPSGSQKIPLRPGHIESGRRRLRAGESYNGMVRSSTVLGARAGAVDERDDGLT
nr:unnamed protein product [Digitaria exilis]